MEFKPKPNEKENVVYINKMDIPRDLALSTGSKSNSAGDDTIDSTQSSDLSVMYNPTYQETPNGLHNMALNGSPDSKWFAVGIVDQDSDCELVIEEAMENGHWNGGNGWKESVGPTNIYEMSYMSKSREFVIDGSITSVDGCFGSKFSPQFGMFGYPIPLHFGVKTFPFEGTVPFEAIRK